jgi:alkylation response protein AidB-like acyl-CoA dehydrogenase
MGTDDESRSRQVAEAARETSWHGHSVLRDIFMGSMDVRVMDPEDLPRDDRPQFVSFYAGLERFLSEQVDPAEIDASGEYPEAVLSGLSELGAFGMKIPERYGGLGFSQREYERVMGLLGSYDANLTALLSAHQSIGVPQPLLLFGTEAQRAAYLPRCARGAISGFALTEPTVGSDPARIETTATPTDDGRAFTLDGEKLWCTNGTLAELLVVMARTPLGISAFVVETAWLGVIVRHRCRFMGLRALANAHLQFEHVRVPRENLIGREGQGLKIALVTLNAGRLGLPAAVTGCARSCLETSRKWSEARVQWGRPIGEHEAITHKLADMAATTFAMGAVSDLAARMADDPSYDIRLEAAAAKEWNTVRAWQIVDDALEIRGGRGYETERSLAGRGEVPIGIERAMRDSRVNRIFEGSSEIMHLFIAREAVDTHLAIAGDLIDPRSTVPAKLRAAFRALGFYLVWYPLRWIGWGHWPRYRRFGPLARHVAFIDRTSRRLARAIFHAMLVYRGHLQRKQAFLARIVDIGVELFAMTAAIGQSRRLLLANAPSAVEARRLADLFCRDSRRTVAERFAALWRNDDVRKYRVGLDVLHGKEAWLEAGIVGLGRSTADLVPPTVTKAKSLSRDSAECLVDSVVTGTRSKQSVSRRVGHGG